MSGPADALTPTLTDRKRSIVALTVGFIIQALQILLGGAGRSVFSLDKYLSWMPHKTDRLFAAIKAESGANVKIEVSTAEGISWQ